MLAGRFRGKRVVFLKQLKSGLLCVTGPFKLNGVPVKRVNQAYTLSTSTKVAVKGVEKVLADVTDDTFTAGKKAKKSQKFLSDNLPKVETSEQRKKLQKSVDDAVLAGCKDKMVKKYLGARFSLTKHDAPHAMKF